MQQEDVNAMRHSLVLMIAVWDVETMYALLLKTVFFAQVIVLLLVVCLFDLF
jgi:hypothetical protein